MASKRRLPSAVAPRLGRLAPSPPTKNRRLRAIPLRPRRFRYWIATTAAGKLSIRLAAIGRESYYLPSRDRRKGLVQEPHWPQTRPRFRSNELRYREPGK